MRFKHCASDQRVGQKRSPNPKPTHHNFETSTNYRYSLHKEARWWGMVVVCLILLEMISWYHTFQRNRLNAFKGRTLICPIHSDTILTCQERNGPRTIPPNLTPGDMPYWQFSTRTGEWSRTISVWTFNAWGPEYTRLGQWISSTLFQAVVCRVLGAKPKPDSKVLFYDL